MIFFILIILIFLFILIILIKSSKPIRKSNSKSLYPFGFRLFYTDQKVSNKKDNIIYSKILFSEKYNIQGKPDFIFKRGKTLFPIELKSGYIKNSPMPHEGDLLQLVAYFLIIEDLYKVKVKKGKLIYADYSFIIKNTKPLRKKLLRTLKDMRLMLKTGEGLPNCSFINCKYCMYKIVCQYYNNH